MSRLLTLSDERIAAELRRVQELAEGYAVWRREWWRFAARCAVPYAAGVVIAFASLGLVGDAAQIALWGGLLIGNSAILVFWITLWAREDL